MIFLASDPYVGRRRKPATYSFYSSVPPPGGNSFFRPSVGSQETYSTAIPCGRSAVELGAERGRDIQICRLGGVLQRVRLRRKALIMGRLLVIINM